MEVDEPIVEWTTTPPQREYLEPWSEEQKRSLEEQVRRWFKERGIASEIADEHKEK